MSYYLNSLRSDIYRVIRNKILIIGFAVYIAISFYALWDYGLTVSYADKQDPISRDGIVREIDYCDDDYARFVHKCAVFSQENKAVPSRDQLASIMKTTSWCPDITVASSEWSLICFLCLLADVVISGENISYMVSEGRSRRRVYLTKLYNSFVIASMFRGLAYMLIYVVNYILHGMYHSTPLLIYLRAYVLGLFPTFGLMCLITMVIFIVWQRVVYYLLVIPYSYFQMVLLAYLITARGMLRSNAMDYTLQGMISAVPFREDIGFTFLCMFYPIPVFAVTSFVGILVFKRRTLR